MTRFQKLFKKPVSQPDLVQDTPLDAGKEKVTTVKAEPEPELCTITVQNQTPQQCDEIFAWCSQNCGDYRDHWYGYKLVNNLILMFTNPDHLTRFKQRFEV
jgi:hypothetical protein